MGIATAPPPVRATEIPGKGRALVASRTINPGEVLLADSPILLYPAGPPPSTSPSFCSHCFRTLPPSSPSFPCPSCSTSTLFCSHHCLSQALAASHTPWVCQTLARLRSSSPPLDPNLIAQANFLVAALNLAAVAPPYFTRLLSLAGAASSADAALAQRLHSLVLSLSPPPAGFSLELVAELLAKDEVNAFGLMEPFGNGERRVRVYGIYPYASFFNHDCLPNACRFEYIDGVGDRNTDIVVRAIHEISEGREVCLSYFPVNWSYKERQQRLQEDYGFLCECERCEVEKNWKDDEESMEGEEDGGEEGMEGLGEENEGEEGDFPHAFFFAMFVCDRQGCGGTLAPLPPSPHGSLSHTLECNFCGKLRKGEAVDGDGDEEGDGDMLDE